MSELEFGGSTFPFMWRGSALDAMRQLKGLGLTAVDILLAPGHLWPDAETRQGSTRLKAMIDNEGLTINSLSLPALDFNLASCLPEVRSLSVDTYKSVIELAKSLGCSGVGLVPGRVSALLPPSHLDSLAWLSDSLAQLTEVAIAHDICLFVETHPHTPVPKCDALASFLQAFDSHHVKIAYDVATAVFTNDDYVGDIRRFGGQIGQIHLSDSPRTSWKHDALGSGDLDLAAALDAIRQSEFNGVTILEIICQDAERGIAQSIEALASQVAFPR